MAKGLGITIRCKASSGHRFCLATIADIIFPVSLQSQNFGQCFYIAIIRSGLARSQCFSRVVQYVHVSDLPRRRPALWHLSLFLSCFLCKLLPPSMNDRPHPMESQPQIVGFRPSRWVTGSTSIYRDLWVGPPPMENAVPSYSATPRVACNTYTAWWLCLGVPYVEASSQSMSGWI